MSDDFRPGDIVRLKSGSPDMVVSGADPAIPASGVHATVWCMYFHAPSGEIKPVYCSPIVLEKVRK